MSTTEVPGPSGENQQTVCEIQVVEEESMDVEEPVKKKPKLETEDKKKAYNLEDRLNGILCCAVCLDLPNVAVYQVGMSLQLYYVYKQISDTCNFCHNRSQHHNVTLSLEAAQARNSHLRVFFLGRARL